MDDKAKQTSNQAQSDQALDPVVQSQPQFQPTGGVNKEVEVKVSDFVKPSETEPQISKEVRESGVNEVKERVPLTLEHNTIGVKHSSEDIVPDTDSPPKVTIPMTEEEAKEIINSGKRKRFSIREVKEGIFEESEPYPFASLMIKIYKSLKNAHQKITGKGN